ncbi:MAG: OmpA family protein [Proteobacteria bacterium]|nr:OmpA family protein [Pseudomonadota bacterium]
MKKSILNIAVTMALTSAIYSGSVLSTQAYANEQITDDMNITNNNSSNDDTTENYMYPGMGVGAATGTLVAGPAGFVVGGLIGAIVGANQDVSSDNETASTDLAENTAVQDSPVSVSDDLPLAETTEQSTLQQGIQVAQLGSINTVVEDSIESQHDTLIDILTADLSLDIYFRSGSTDIEAFYPARLSAIADLMNTMDKLELHLDGYSDRRGNKTKNIALANERIAKVREQLIDAGVDETRIISKAFGEMKMVSAAGDLEAYTFDRKVVIRFERSSANSIHAMTTALSAPESVSDTTSKTEIEIAETASSTADENTGPVVADATTRF